MKVAIAKPDYGTVGGFEIVVQRLADGLRRRGHAVDLVQVDATTSPTSHLPVEVSEEQLLLFREFFLHLNMIARFEELDLSAYDAVLCTQPGSYAVRHARKVVLFYHHTRSFYDLQDVIERVRGHDVDLHRLASAIVRDIDAFHLTPSVRILAGSLRVKQRLTEFNGLDPSVEIFTAGLDEAFLEFEGPLTFESPLCVGRHEFPKRTELFIHAVNHLDGLDGRILGVGSFTDRLKGIDAWLRVRHLDGHGRADRSICPVDDGRLWREHTIHMTSEELLIAQAIVTARGLPSRVRFLGRSSQQELLKEYTSALCVVCPAFDEDFGLTCLEAMACGKPVIACTDGGGYIELIEDGVDGFLVDPTGPAIAEAIARLTDRDLARAMGARGRQKARAFTWSRAIDQVERALLA
ncbi:MAG TPA: glycosyltransferase family 4 protein [Vicinamibacterales bacterium]|nr:glycosyltransferase family 4 protein [Vicinamibacterales bacterium]